MELNLVPGQNCPLPDGPLIATLTSGKPADFSAFKLYANGKTSRDDDFVFYGQPGGADLRLEATSTSAVFRADPARFPTGVEKIAFCVTSDFPTVADLGALTMTIAGEGGEIARCATNVAGRSEAALILGEIYRRGGQWKFRFVDQGFNGGLKPLAEMYGVDVADDAPPPPPEKKINLSKISLTKSKPRVDLEKRGFKGGELRVNLNWHRGQGGWRGMFGGGKDIDLDLGAYVRCKNGRATIVQALGNTFGSLDSFPYVRLMGDDRTGEQTEGEWIYINGERLDEIEEIVIYTFIYEGVPNWSSADGVVRVEIPGQPEIETRLEGSDNSLPMRAVARIVSRGGTLSVERLDRSFRGHRDMDQAFGWGFSWSPGRK